MYFFCNYFRKANEQQLCNPFQQNGFCCYSFLYITSLLQQFLRNATFITKSVRTIFSNKKFMYLHFPYFINKSFQCCCYPSYFLKVFNDHTQKYLSFLGNSWILFDRFYREKTHFRPQTKTTQEQLVLKKSRLLFKG